ncbi:MAG: LysR family transcriptional regulator, partial [Paracoccaceae bacterium]|nr:LysR family transcriptional regulator [Paracoccaceae bacterium]
MTGFDRLPLDWIRAFEIAARTGSFTAAAQEAGLTQSAISQRIANLEKRLGAPLFLREARQIRLTTEGEIWLPHVQAALESLRDSSEALFGVARNRLVLSASA